MELFLPVQGACYRILGRPLFNCEGIVVLKILLHSGSPMKFFSVLGFFFFCLVVWEFCVCVFLLFVCLFGNLGSRLGYSERSQE